MAIHSVSLSSGNARDRNYNYQTVGNVEYEVGDTVLVTDGVSRYREAVIQVLNVGGRASPGMFIVTKIDLEAYNGHKLKQRRMNELQNVLNDKLYRQLERDPVSLYDSLVIEDNEQNIKEMYEEWKELNS